MSLRPVRVHSYFIATIAAYAVVLLSQLPTSAETRSEIRFEDSTAASQIAFQHRDGSNGQHFLMEAIASGVVTFDFDRDGDADIYFLNGAALRGTEYSTPPTNELYRNDGGGRFTNVTEAAGLTDLGYALGGTAGDLDNDGWPDLYVNNFGSNSVYFNNGDGSFRKGTDPVTACGEKVGAGVSFLDIENDGDLDIYVANYIKFEYGLREPSVFHGRVVYGGPILYPSEADDLLRNNGDGTFSNVRESSGIASESEWGMATLVLDVDQDGDSDILVANDSTKNFLWLNDGHGNFEESALLAGFAFDERGQPQGSMGIDAADINGDGNIDVFQTAYENQTATLFTNLGGGLFQDTTLRAGALAITDHLVNWGTGFADFDNDGDPDLYVANGHIHDNMDEFNDRSQYRMSDLVFENDGRGRFRDVSDSAGITKLPPQSSRGLALEDFDGDGRVDVLVVNSRTTPTLLRNTSTGEEHWIEIELRGRQCNRDGVGSRVTIESAGKSQVLEVHSGRGYQSQFGSVLHFGIGSATTVDRITVHWLGGPSETVEGAAADQRWLIRQGMGLESYRSRRAAKLEVSKPEGTVVSE